MRIARLHHLLALALLVALSTACGEAPADLGAGDQTNVPRKSLQPLTPSPDASATDWLAFSPHRAQMRALWIDCANIVHFGNDPDREHYDSIECAGEDLARKAGRFAGFWDALETAAEKTSDAARAGAWDRARVAYAGLWKACCDCHVETWPLSLRGYTEETLRSWVETGRVQREVTWTTAYDDRLNATPRSPFHERMQRLHELADSMADGLTEEDADGVAEGATRIVTQLEGERDYWWSIHDRSKALQQAAAKWKTGVIRSLYAGISKSCHDCHAMSTTDGRTPLDPPPWTAPRRD